MFSTGLCSITFRQIPAEDLISLVKESGLDGLEWGGDVHVPHGDGPLATQIGDATRDAGLSVLSYGSYYRVGVSEDDGLAFSDVLASAVALKAPGIRVWAGNQGSEESDATYVQKVADDAHRIAQMAADAGIWVAFEWHRNTLTDTLESGLRLLDASNHENMGTYWQPPVGMAQEDCLKELEALLPRLRNIHVFHWQGGWADRLSLAEGEECWLSYLRLAATTGRDHALQMEFVKDDAPEQFSQDAATLRAFSNKVSGA